MCESASFYIPSVSHHTIPDKQTHKACNNQVGCGNRSKLCRSFRRAIKNTSLEILLELLLTPMCLAHFGTLLIYALGYGEIKNSSDANLWQAIFEYISSYARCQSVIEDAKI